MPHAYVSTLIAGRSCDGVVNRELVHKVVADVLVKSTKCGNISKGARRTDTSFLQALALARPLEKQLARRLQKRGDSEPAAAPPSSPGTPLVIFAEVPSQLVRRAWEAVDAPATQVCGTWCSSVYLQGRRFAAELCVSVSQQVQELCWLARCLIHSCAHSCMPY